MIQKSDDQVFVMVASSQCKYQMGIYQLSDLSFAPMQEETLKCPVKAQLLDDKYIFVNDKDNNLFILKDDLSIKYEHVDKNANFVIIGNKLYG